jgi:hypothetical protein
MHSRLGSVLTFSLALSVSCTPVVVAQEIEQFLPKASAPCVGDLEKRHRSDPPWDFTTNSRRPTANEPTVYLHCVFNNDSKNYLEVNWLIPKVKQPIPAKMAALSPRYSDRTPAGQPDGCLVFGNLLNKALKAQFWARPEDMREVDGEGGKDCLNLTQTSTQTERRRAEKPADIVAPFRTFLHADPNSQTSALVALEGITGLRMKSAGTYQSFVTYRFRNEQDKAPPELDGAYTLFPRWTGPAELLAKSFITQNKGPVELLSRSEQTTVSFLVEGTGDWDLQELEYTVVDRTGKVAASFFAPVFIPLPAR